MIGSIRLSLTIRDGEVVELIRRRRWPNGVKCPYCGSITVRNGRPARRLYVQRYLCKGCRRQFHDLSGTVFAKTRLSPSEALTIAYLYYKLGLSVLAVSREVGRSRKTVDRVIRLFREYLEAYFQQLKTERRG
ncbi:MAG: transposase [Nitrososphaerota archaeon]